MTEPTVQDIVAAFHRTKLVCHPQMFYAPETDEKDPRPCGCAIGATLIDKLGVEEYKTERLRWNGDVIGLFARTLGTNEDYAEGLNDGFTLGRALTYRWGRPAQDKPYDAGCALGKQARAAVLADDTIPKAADIVEDDK